MNLREKFFWNAVLTFSIIILLWNAWNLFNQHKKSSSLLNKYKNEDIGTDEELEIMVKDLEKNLKKRQELKFAIKENPVDLTKVVSIDGITSTKGQKGIDCTGVMSDNKGIWIADCLYKGQRYEVTKGDSIGGGIVKSISRTNISIAKGEELLKFNVGF